MTGAKDGVTIVLSSGKIVTASRASVKACADQTALSAYVTKVLA
jgi:hypothetical protein